MEAARPQSLLIITGSMGSGKTSVMAEASDILALRNVPHAAIDLDMLGMKHLPSGGNSDDVMYRNLRAVAQNYVDLGIERFLLARAVENQAEFQRCIAAVGVKGAALCRLTASLPTMVRRVASRELGACRSNYIARVAMLNEILDRAHLKNFTVINEDRPLTEVANELLERAHWL